MAQKRVTAASLRPKQSAAEPPATPRGGLVSEQERLRGVFTAAQSGKPAPLVNSTEALRGRMETTRRGNGGGRSEPNYDVPQWMKDRDVAFNKANRRELTEDEWNRLSAPQKQQVQLNNDLVRAYDADVTAGNRDATKAVFSQLGLAPDVEERLTKDMGVDVRGQVRFDDLFGAPVGSGVRAPGASAPEQSIFDRVVRGPETAPGARGDRAAMIASIAQGLSRYFGPQNEQRTGALLGQAQEASKGYSFQSDQAKLDYEYSFDYLLNKNALAEMPWAEAKLALEQSGYNPEDFRNYARDRIQLYPTGADRTSLQDLESWFGSE